MTKLNLAPNLNAPDDLYADLISAHDGLSEEESAALNARLILILANHIGSRDIFCSALKAAENGKS